MASQVRVLIIALIALFAAGTVVQSAAASSMSLMMALSGVGAAEKTDCQDCGTGNESEDGMLACDVDCTMSFAAHLGQTDPGAVPDADPAMLPTTDHLTGRTRGPELQPPRFLI